MLGFFESVFYRLSLYNGWATAASFCKNCAKKDRTKNKKGGLVMHDGLDRTKARS
jgi:hypothetical protein